MGFIFIWVEKRLISDVLDVLLTFGFKYVENLVWVRQDINNKVLQEDAAYFRRSKSTLLMCRKASNKHVELRHQRSPDVVFDFVRKLPGTDMEEPPVAVYDMIETLLPTALYDSKTNRGRLLEL